MPLYAYGRSSGGEGENVMTVAPAPAMTLRLPAGWRARAFIFLAVNDANGALSAGWEISKHVTPVVVSQGRVVFTTSG